MSCEELRSVSGDVEMDDPLADFLYHLMRDQVSPGRVEKLVLDSLRETGPCIYTNGWLAKYAEYLAGKLRTSYKPESESAPTTTPAPF